MPFFLPCLFCWTLIQHDCQDIFAWIHITTWFALRPFPPVSFMLNLDSTWLPGHICVNPHHDLVCITPFFLGFPCVFSAEPWFNTTAGAQALACGSLREYFPRLFVHFPVFRWASSSFLNPGPGRLPASSYK
jgi:hypothetical protein